MYQQIHSMGSREKLHGETSLCHARTQAVTQCSRMDAAGAVLRGFGGSTAMTGYKVTESRLRCVLPFEADPVEIRLLRRAVVTQLGQWAISAVADEAQLVVAELATNVFKHVGAGVAATLILESQPDRLRLEVHDKSHDVPSRVRPECDEECGRGLHLLAGIAADWGTLVTASGKAVWCEIRVSKLCGDRSADRAVAVLQAYQEKRGSRALLSRGLKPAGLAEAAVELVADLLHWAALEGDDPDDFLDRAQVHYEAESGAA